MCDHWMPLVKLRISMEQFQQLPRNAAYKYEYVDRQAYLSPRPRHFHALLDLQQPRAAADKEVEIGPLPPENVMDLANLFAAAFSTIQPYGCLDDRTRLRAAREALARVLAGGDGPFIEGASFVAREREQIVGAILLTLLPLGDPCDYECYEWKSAPPADCIARCLGRPHLTWIFVSPLHVGRGAGTALLAAAATRLLELGFRQLLSTFMIGNESSMLWHWRNGFELLSHPASYRLMKRRWQRYLQPGGDAAEV